MRRKEIYLILFLILLIVSLFVYMYVFNIYEVNISVKPKELFADNQSVVTIHTIPLNSFGARVPFRNVFSDFKINEGENLVTIVRQDNLNGILIIKAKDRTGKVEVIIKTEKSLLPSVVDIFIRPNFASAVNK